MELAAVARQLVGLILAAVDPEPRVRDLLSAVSSSANNLMVYFSKSSPFTDYFIQMNAFTAGLLASIMAAAIVALLATYWARSRPHLRKALRRVKWAHQVRVSQTWNLPAIYKKMKVAKQRVLILQTWFPDWEREYAAWNELMQELKTRKASGTMPPFEFEFKVLLMDPSLYDARLRARGDLRNLVVGRTAKFLEPKLEEIRRFVSEHSNANTHIRIAIYNSIPFGPIYCIDDEVYWGLFVSNKDSMDSACFSASCESELGMEILGSLLNSWRARSSEITPLHRGKERRAHELEVSRAFNELRGELSRFEFLGRIGLNGENLICSQKLLQCLPACLNRDVQTLVVLRHAATPLNEHRIFSGLLPVRLSSHGRKQVLLIRERVAGLSSRGWGQVLCSTVVRTRETLETLLPPCDIIPARELDERNIGLLEGRDKEEKSDDLRDCWKFFWEPPLGESFAQLFLRLKESEFLQDLAIRGARGLQNSLVCTHEGPLKLIRMLFEINRDLQPHELDVIEDIVIRNCDMFIYVDLGSIREKGSGGNSAESELLALADICIREAEEYAVWRVSRSFANTSNTKNDDGSLG